MEPSTLIFLGYLAYQAVRSFSEPTEETAQAVDPRKAEEIAELSANPTYFIIALLAKFAKQDGVVTKKEIACVERILRDMDVTVEGRKQAIDIFRRHKQGVLTYGEASLLFCRHHANSRRFTLVICLFLLRLANADGPASAESIQAVKEACKALTVEYSKVEEMYLSSEAETRAAEDAACSILGCESSDSIETIRNATCNLRRSIIRTPLRGKIFLLSLFNWRKRSFAPSKKPTIRSLRYAWH